MPYFSSPSSESTSLYSRDGSNFKQNDTLKYTHLAEPMAKELFRISCYKEHKVSLSYKTENTVGTCD